MSAHHSWDIYPRPQFRRDSFFSLNGSWKLEFVKNDEILSSKPVCVPFAPQSVLSGVHDPVDDQTVLWYTRSFSLPEEMKAGLSSSEEAPSLSLLAPAPRRILLHFGAVDQVARVYLNGVFIGEHEGGYTSFTLDVTEALIEVSGEKMEEDGTFRKVTPDDTNELVVEVEDHLDEHLYPYGKQKHKNGGIWYTPVSGIWQSVWMESVPENYLEGFSVETQDQTVVIRVDKICHAVSDGEVPGVQDGEGPTGMDKEASAGTAGENPAAPEAEADTPEDPDDIIGIPLEIREARLNSIPPEEPPVTLTLHLPDGDRIFFENDGEFRIPLEAPHFWSPEDPFLYDFSLDLGEDHVDAYFAYRTLKTAEVNGIPRLLLNDKPYFFHGVLDQGYFADGIYTPSSPEDYRKDLQLLKDCGFNMLRKHIKIEPEIFYYYCDSMGIAVFQDMVNNGEYKYFLDTVLPTLKVLKKRSDKKLNPNAEKRQMFLQCAEESIRQLKNHPCIVSWTIFNEGWGQFDGDQAYAFVKSIDSSRFVDTASGWFSSVESDVYSDHVYFRPVKPVKSSKPYVLSEFGGYALKTEGHVFDENKSYGYKTFTDREAFMDALEALYRREIIPAVSQGMCADIYTQLSDVEVEINGLVTYDRAVVKVDPARLKAIAEELYREITSET